MSFIFSRKRRGDPDNPKECKQCKNLIHVFTCAWIQTNAFVSVPHFRGEMLFFTWRNVNPRKKFAPSSIKSHLDSSPSHLNRRWRENWIAKVWTLERTILCCGVVVAKTAGRSCACFLTPGESKTRLKVGSRLYSSEPRLPFSFVRPRDHRNKGRTRLIYLFLRIPGFLLHNRDI